MNVLSGRVMSRKRILKEFISQQSLEIKTDDQAAIRNYCDETCSGERGQDEPKHTGLLPKK